uniref:Uncharacterized protein n=1 Tax=Oryza rufipogon TaxID=4529 RepID=A0A0E0NRV1_ORYRU
MAEWWRRRSCIWGVENRRNCRESVGWEGEKVWDPRLARPFWLAKVGQREKCFGQPDGLAIRLANLLEHDFDLKLPKFGLESELRCHCPPRTTVQIGRKKAMLG